MTMHGTFTRTGPFTRRLLLAASLMLCACTNKLTQETADTGPEPIEPNATISAAPAFDPLLRGSATWLVQSQGAESLRVDIESSDGTIVISSEHEIPEDGVVSGSWDGRDTSGEYAGTGSFTIVASLINEVGESIAVATHAMEVVRVGFLTSYLEDDDGTTATRAPLYWHEIGELQDVTAPMSELQTLEDEEGNAQDFPEITESLDIPELGMGQPAAFVWDSRPILTLVPGNASLLGDLNLENTTVDLQVDGWTVISEDVPLDGETPVVLQPDEALSNGPGVYDTKLLLSFVVESDSGTEWEVGSQVLPIRVYLLYDEPSFQENGERYNPWVAVVDPVLRAIDGVDPTHDAVTNAIVNHVFDDLGLRYDINYGASYYMNYAGSGWNRPHFYLSQFLKRQYGYTVNCSDCAVILAAFCNMVGAELNHLIILSNFGLNEILAIGQPDFTSCPFGSGGCGFSYHAVTTDDAGQTIWDATLALDGDDDPGASPSEVMMVEAIDGQEYLDRLVRSGNAGYYYESQGTLQ